MTDLGRKTRKNPFFQAITSTEMQRNRQIAEAARREADTKSGSQQQG